MLRTYFSWSGWRYSVCFLLYIVIFWPPACRNFPKSLVDGCSECFKSLPAFHQTDFPPTCNVGVSEIIDLFVCPAQWLQQLCVDNNPPKVDGTNCVLRHYPLLHDRVGICHHKRDAGWWVIQPQCFSMIWNTHASHHDCSVICHVSAIEKSVYLSRYNLLGYPDHFRSNYRNSEQVYLRSRR